jgi:S1-C subfamily serine protease
MRRRVDCPGPAGPTGPALRVVGTGIAVDAGAAHASDPTGRATLRGAARLRHRPTVLAAALLLLVAGRAAQAADEDEFERKTVRIGCFAKNAQGKIVQAGHGSGFLVSDDRHVVTNHHVALSDPCRVGVPAVLVGRDVIPLKVLAHSETNDLAVLEADKPIPDKEPVTGIVPARGVATRDEVYVLGFPYIVDDMAAQDNVLRPTTTRGIVGRKIETPEKTGMLQIDARTVGGNSGGPWFDACGRLVGIHARGSYQFLSQGRDANGKERVERLPVGYGYAVQTDHLLPLLDSARVPYSLAGRCSFVVRHASTLALGSALLVGSGVALRYSPPGQRLWARLAQPLLPGSGVAPAGPHLVGLGGALRGVTVPFDDGPIVIGRDPRVANLALPASCDDVSKRHCRVQLEPDGGFLLEDCWSTNGTFLASGERLAPGSSRRLAAGARFYLADASQMFELRAGGGR